MTPSRPPSTAVSEAGERAPSALAPQETRTPQRGGFDLTSAPVEEALIRWAHAVWDDQAVGLIYTHYAHNTPVHRPDGDDYGRDAVVERAVRTLAAFPDLRLHGDEVIWREDDHGIHVSHRFTWSGHHLGHGGYGPPTGRRGRRREVAWRLLRGGRVVEEWAVHDEIALIRQLGLDEVELARTLARAGAEFGGLPPTLGEVPRSRGQVAPPTELGGDPRDPDALPDLLYGLVWNARMLSHIARYYAPGAVVRVPGARRLEGHAALRAYVLELLAAFPDGAMTVDQALWSGDEAAGDKVAVRWTFQGTHGGPGPYGLPTGKRVRVPGISHLRVRDGRIEREDMLWDEFALLVQLHAPT